MGKVIKEKCERCSGDLYFGISTNKKAYAFVCPKCHTLTEHSFVSGKEVINVVENFRFEEENSNENKSSTQR